MGRWDRRMDWREQKVIGLAEFGDDFFLELARCEFGSVFLFLTENLLLYRNGTGRVWDPESF